jgi:hypothetical protein
LAWGFEGLVNETNENIPKTIPFGSIGAMIYSPSSSIGTYHVPKGSTSRREPNGTPSFSNDNLKEVKSRPLSLLKKKGVKRKRSKMEREI